MTNALISLLVICGGGIIQIVCECVFCSNICVYVCSSLKQEEEERHKVVFTYMCAWVHAKTKRYTAVKHVPASWLNVSVPLWEDVEVHERFSILKDGKCTNFSKARNIILQAVCFLLLFFFFFFIFGCVLLSSCLKQWLATRLKNLGGCVKAKEKYCKSVKYICSPVTGAASNARFIFARDKFQMHRRSRKYRHVTILSNQVPETIWFILTPSYFCYIIAEGFRFMPLSLVRLRTIRLSAWFSWVQPWCRW